MSKLIEYFRKISNEFIAKYETTKEIKHTSLKGENREYFIKEFLEKLYPKKFVIGTGEILDSDGNISSQADIILYNEINPVFDYGITKLFLSSGVIAHIEVKSDLGKQLNNGLDICKSIKSLNHDIVGSIGFMVDHKITQKFRKKIFSCIFAYECTYTHEITFKEKILKYENENGIDICVDVICVLNKYIMHKNYQKNELEFLNTKGDSLMAFYYKLYEVLNSTFLNYTPINKFFKVEELTFYEF